MCIRSARRLLPLGLAAALAAGCAASGSRPLGGTPEILVALNQGYGSWVRVRSGVWRSATTTDGELIAVAADSLLLLTPTGIEAIAMRRATSVALPTEFGAEEVVGAGAWREMRKHARFPQGLPEGLDRGLLRPRPAGR